MGNGLLFSGFSFKGYVSIWFYWLIADLFFWGSIPPYLYFPRGEGAGGGEENSSPTLLPSFMVLDF